MYFQILGRLDKFYGKNKLSFDPKWTEQAF